MKRFCKCTISVLAGAIALAALSGCGSAETTDTVVGSAESEEIVTSVSSAAETSDTSGVSTEDSAADTAAVKTITPADSFAGGSGTEEDPYQISTAEQLARLGLVTDFYYEDAVDYFDSYYVLTDDIYLNDTSDYDNWSETAPEYAWIPISPDANVYFDGQDHTIYGMYIENCTNKGAITGDTYVGGIVGYVERPGTDITVSDCSNEADVTAEEDCVGGIIGGITSIDLGTSDNSPTFTVEACTNSGKISSGDGISGTGGIVGGTVSGIETSMTLVISRCTNSGEVYASQAAHIGGILGGTGAAVANAVIDVQIVDCVNTGSIGLGDQSVAYADLSESDEETSTDEKVILYLGGSCVGGIAGMAENTGIDNCVNSGSLLLDAAMYSDTIYVGSIVGQYRYTDGNDYADNIGVRNCSYSTPEDAYSPNNLTPEVLAEIITGMNRGSASEAETLAAEVVQ